MNYVQNDILIDKDGNKVKVLGVAGLLYWVSYNDDFTKASRYPYTI